MFWVRVTIALLRSGSSCFFLAFWVEARFWLIGTGLIAAGLVWRFLALLLRGPSEPAA